MGQTVSLLSRVAAHRRTWPGQIVAVRFAPTPPSDLDKAERDAIRHLVDGGSRLRNKDLVTLPLRGDALDLVVDHAVQEAWLEGDTEEFDVLSRVTAARQRARTESKFRRLKAHPEFPALVGALSSYVHQCIPQPDATEWRFWVVTSLPSTGDGRRLTALSINNVEVLVLRGTEPGRANEGFLNLAYDTVVPKHLRHLAYQHSYRSVGDVVGIDVRHPSQVAQLLTDPDIVAGARRLALGLLRKGRGLFGRFHDFNLADAVFRAWPAS